MVRKTAILFATGACEDLESNCEVTCSPISKNFLIFSKISKSDKVFLSSQGSKNMSE